MPVIHWKRTVPAWSRRRFLIGATIACCSSRISAAAQQDFSHALKEIETAIGGRLGVFAIDTGIGRQLEYRPDERFAMCSTFKWALAASVLARVDRGQTSLAERVFYDSADLLDHAPITSQHVAAGSMAVEGLAQAIVTVSDNTAANLLLEKVGGPTALTQFFRSLGDSVTRLDRNELALNDNEPGDPRDTTSPRAMVSLMRGVLCGDVLSSANRDRLLGWLRASETGKNRLRSGLPRDWAVGDKTGTGMRGAVNDLAIAEPPRRAPILIAVYMSGGGAALEVREKAHADIGRLVARQLSV